MWRFNLIESALSSIHYQRDWSTPGKTVQAAAAELLLRVSQTTWSKRRYTTFNDYTYKIIITTHELVIEVHATRQTKHDTTLVKLAVFRAYELPHKPKIGTAFGRRQPDTIAI